MSFTKYNNVFKCRTSVPNTVHRGKQLTLKSGDKGNMGSNQYQFWSAWLWKWRLPSPSKRWGLLVQGQSVNPERDEASATPRWVSQIWRSNDCLQKKVADVKRTNAMNTTLSLKNLLSQAGINAHSVYKTRLFKLKLSKSKLKDSNSETGILLPNKVVHTASFFKNKNQLDVTII